MKNKSPYRFVANQDLSKLKLNPDNPREHDDFDLSFLVRSFEHYGFVDPIIAQEKTMLVLAGHGRIQAAARAGITKAPVLFVKMADEKTMGYTVAANRSGELSRRNEEKLKAIFVEFTDKGEDPTLTGFDESEIRRAVEKHYDQELGGDAKDRHPRMEIQPYEHYDYILFVFRDVRDFIVATDRLKLKTVDGGYSAKTSGKKVGLGRVIDGKKLLELFAMKEKAK